MAEARKYNPTQQGIPAAPPTTTQEYYSRQISEVSGISQLIQAAATKLGQSGAGVEAEDPAGSRKYSDKPGELLATDPLPGETSRYSRVYERNVYITFDPNQPGSAQVAAAVAQEISSHQTGVHPILKAGKDQPEAPHEETQYNTSNGYTSSGDGRNH